MNGTIVGMLHSRRQLVGGSLLGLTFLAAAGLLNRTANYPESRLQPYRKAEFNFLSAQEAYLLDTQSMAMFPGEENTSAASEYLPNAREAKVLPYLDGFLDYVQPRQSGNVRLGLLGIENGPLVLGHRQRLSDFTLPLRIEMLEKMRTGPLFLSALVTGIRSLVAFAYWRDAHTQGKIGVYDKCPSGSGTLFDGLNIEL